VRRAIDEELSRNGQVYFIHNRVESIYSIAELIQKLVPKARVVVGHGQMGERELESVMLKFMHDEANVLVSTTIVENGMDIPRANTIIIIARTSWGFRSCISCGEVWEGRISGRMHICWCRRIRP